MSGAISTGAQRKPRHWVASSKKSLGKLPEEVKDVIGHDLLDLQYGDLPAGARPFGEGLPIDHHHATYHDSLK